MKHFFKMCSAFALVVSLTCTFTSIIFASEKEDKSFGQYMSSPQFLVSLGAAIVLRFGPDIYSGIKDTLYLYTCLSSEQRAFVLQERERKEQEIEQDKENERKIRALQAEDATIEASRLNLKVTFGQLKQQKRLGKIEHMHELIQKGCFSPEEQKIKQEFIKQYAEAKLNKELKKFSNKN